MLLKLERDTAFYMRQQQVGLSRAKLFSWEKTAQELLGVYKKVGKRS
jgi:hypothetical protein